MNDIVLGSLVAQVCQRRTDVDLDTLGHALADLHIVLTRHILLDVCVQIIASHLDAGIGNDTTQRDDGNLGRTATDVDNHVALGRLDVDTDTDSSCHRLENQIDITAVGMLGRVTDGTQLHFRRA